MQFTFEELDLYFTEGRLQCLLCLSFNPHWPRNGWCDGIFVEM